MFGEVPSLMCFCFPVCKCYKSVRWKIHVVSVPRKNAVNLSTIILKTSKAKRIPSARSVVQRNSAVRLAPGFHEVNKIVCCNDHVRCRQRVMFKKRLYEAEWVKSHFLHCGKSKHFEVFLTVKAYQPLPPCHTSISDLSQLDLIIKQGFRAPGPLNSCQLQYKHVLMRNIFIPFKTAFFWQKTVPLANLHAAPLLNMAPLLPHTQAPEPRGEDNYAACLQCIELLLPGCLSSLGVRCQGTESSEVGWFNVCT